MIVTRKHIPRRTVLRGVGVTLALPFLDSMVPALTAASAPPTRLGIVYLPNGVRMDHWTPASEGAFEMTRILAPLEAYRDRLIVLSGLTNSLGVQASGVH